MPASPAHADLPPPRPPTLSPPPIKGARAYPHMRPGELVGGDGTRPNSGESPSGISRGDRFVYFNELDSVPMPATATVVAAVAVVAGALSRPLGSRAGLHLMSRTHSLLACFPGGGAQYGAHFDGGGTDGRRLTAVAYANCGWQPAHGGELLLLDETTANQTTADETRADETPADETRAQEARADGASAVLQAPSCRAPSAVGHGVAVARRDESLTGLGYKGHGGFRQPPAAESDVASASQGQGAGWRAQPEECRAPAGAEGGRGPCWRAVAPQADTLILFRADRVLHKVAPARATRYALTTFFFGHATGGHGNGMWDGSV